jgi:hypothetical protein
MSRQAKKLADLERIEYYKSQVYVAPSQIPGAGLGVYSNVDIPRNTAIGLYEGCSRNKYRTADGLYTSAYIWGQFDGLDPLGQLVFSNGVRLSPAQALAMHNTGELNLFHEKPIYVGVEANWTRFMNDHKDNRNNVRHSQPAQVKSGQFHRLRMFYAPKPIEAHTELTFSYGQYYWNMMHPDN